MISVVIPTYNEGNILEKNTLAIRSAVAALAKSRKESYEIIIVEESKDETPVIADKLAKKYREIKHIRSDVRLGKGGAIEKGSLAAKGDKIAFIDLDLSTGVEFIPDLIENLDKYDIVMGSRYHPESKTRRVFLRLFLSKCYSMISRVLLGIHHRDVQCGFKAFRKPVIGIFPKIWDKTYFWDSEFVFFSRKAGFTVREIPITWIEDKENITTTFLMIRHLTKLFFRRILG